MNASPVALLSLLRRLGAVLGLTLLASAFASCGQHAQPPSEAGSSAAGFGTSSSRGHFGEALMSLNLTDAQKAKIRSIMRAARAKSANADPETRRANMRAAFRQIQSVLTPSQRAALRAKFGRRRHRRFDAGSSSSP